MAEDKPQGFKIELSNEKLQLLLDKINEYMQNHTKHLPGNLVAFEFNEGDWINYVFDNVCKDFTQKECYEAGIFVFTKIAEVLMLVQKNAYAHTSVKREIKEGLK